MYGVSFAAFYKSRTPRVNGKRPQYSNSAAGNLASCEGYGRFKGVMSCGKPHVDAAQAICTYKFNAACEKYRHEYGPGDFKDY